MLERLQATEWDAVVVGTGMGGSTCGFELARRGHSVLFLERGRARSAPSAPLDQSAPDRRLQAGWWPSPFVRSYDWRQTVGYYPVGCGVGGGTSLYAMVLERFFPQDFHPRQNHPAADASNLPEAWPIDYAALSPFYAVAERLFRVRGTADPLRPGADFQLIDPPAPSEKEALLSATLAESGLHPYRLHSACEALPGCARCRAEICHRACRNDAWKICLAPATLTHGAELISECSVERLRVSGRTATGVVCHWRGAPLEVRGKIVILAAGAFQTPRLLLTSTSEAFPQGLANSSGQVGHNLMFHVSDAFALTIPGAQVDPVMPHGVSFNDYYDDGGDKLGNVHAHSIAPGPDLEQWLGRFGVRPNSSTVLLATILEDLPYLQNRVHPPRAGEEHLAFTYTPSVELIQRTERLRQRLKDELGARATVHLLTGDDNLNWSHACGTCRMGREPRDSVVDPSNRCHDLDNVYVADASFFPSSGGINPSLTIAANALRLADLLDRRLG